MACSTWHLPGLERAVRWLLVTPGMHQEHRPHGVLTLPFRMRFGDRPPSSRRPTGPTGAALQS